MSKNGEHSVIKPTSIPLLSVVVPFHNVEPYFAFLLDSLREQSLANAEFILVADAPTDGSLAIAEAAVRNDDRFFVVERPRGGPGPAKNLGATYATGKYLAFADGDDAVTKHGYEIMVRTLERTGSCFASANAQRFDDDMHVWQSWTHREAFTQTRLKTHLREFPDLAADRMTTSKVFRRDFWDEAELAYPARLYEDLPVAMKAHVSAHSVDVIKDYCYLWRARQSNDSITQSIHDAQNALDRATSVLQVIDYAEVGAPNALGRLAQYVAEIDVPALNSVAAGSRTPDLDNLVNEVNGRVHAIFQGAGLETLSIDTANSVPVLSPATLTFDEKARQLSVSLEGEWGLHSWGLRAHGATQADTLVVAEVTSAEDNPYTLSAELDSVTASLEERVYSLYAIAKEPSSSDTQSVIVRSTALPLATPAREKFLAWGAYGAGTVGITPVTPAQVAHFSIDDARLTVEMSTSSLAGVIELRHPNGAAMARTPLIDGCASFDLAALASLATPDDPVQRRTQWLILLDRAGDCRQLHPISLSGQCDGKSDMRVDFSRTAQGAVLLSFTWVDETR